MSEPVANNPPRQLGSDIDLYCLECGYNLRGLSGNPRRCPECGYDNPLGDLEIPAVFITEQLKRMETPPVVCVIMVTLACVFVFILLHMLITTPPNRLELLPICGLGLVQVIIAYFWYDHVHRFREHCLYSPGWQRALWLYHLYTLALIAAIVGLLVLEIYLFFILLNRSDGRETGEWLLFVASSLFLTIAIIGGRWSHRRLRGLLDPLQREVAVTLARDRLRRKLRKP